MRLRQILFNLLSNAAKFTQAGHIALGVQVEAPALHLWVEDSGCGIDLDLQQRIFEAFGAAERPARPGQGIGLGLRLTHELVRLHGGSMSVASEKGIGSTFHVYLPLRTRAEPLQANPPPRKAARPTALELPSSASRITRQAVDYLREHYVESEARGEIARQLGVSESYLTRVFRRDLGLTPSEYLTRLRIERGEGFAARRQPDRYRGGEPGWVQRCGLFQPGFPPGDRPKSTHLPPQYPLAVSCFSKIRVVLCKTSPRSFAIIVMTNFINCLLRSPDRKEMAVQEATILLLEED